MRDSVRSGVKRNCDDYDQVVWWAEIPREKECYCAAWDLGRDAAYDDWLRIERPRRKRPHRRRLYWPWLNERDIADASQDAPQLKESIVEEFHAKDAESAEPETIVRRLEDAPSITRQWELYIDNIWLPWASEERRLQPVVSRCTRAPKTAETPVSVSVIDKQDEQLGPCGDSCHSRVLAMFSPNLRGSGCSAKLNSASTIPALARLIASQPAPS